MQNTLITIALRGITVLPRMRIYLDMNRPMSIAAATNAQKTNQNVFLVAQKDPSVENPGQEQLEQFGVISGSWPTSFEFRRRAAEPPAAEM